MRLPRPRRTTTRALLATLLGAAMLATGLPAGARDPSVPDDPYI